LRCFGHRYNRDKRDKRDKRDDLPHTAYRTLQKVIFEHPIAKKLIEVETPYKLFFYSIKQSEMP
jgi:hypothetical protein